jgi:hypothetical protein
MCNEAEVRDRRAYGPSGLDAFRVGNVSHNHFGLVLVSCERADLRPTPRGVWIYADDGRQLDELPGPSFLEPKSWMSCAMPSCSNARRYIRENGVLRRWNVASAFLRPPGPDATSRDDTR